GGELLGRPGGLLADRTGLGAHPAEGLLAGVVQLIHGLVEPLLQLGVGVGDAVQHLLHPGGGAELLHGGLTAVGQLVVGLLDALLGVLVAGLGVLFRVLVAGLGVVDGVLVADLGVVDGVLVALLQLIGGEVLPQLGRQVLHLGG